MGDAQKPNLIVTLAGGDTKERAYVDAVGSKARFDRPHGLCLSTASGGGAEAGG